MIKIQNIIKNKKGLGKKKAMVAVILILAGTAGLTAALKRRTMRLDSGDFQKSGSGFKIQAKPFEGQGQTKLNQGSELKLSKKTLVVSALPYSTNEFTIEYLPAVDTFIIQIKRPPFETNKTSALNWFKQFGVEKPESEFKILLTSEKGVY